jgi:2-polyprenyl-6-hydroxyphenyl methylase/3-demethylubiquinone-9 3-methyltransferase
MKEFNKLSEWWDPRGKHKGLHLLNQVRFEYFKKNSGDLEGKKVLDVGCGGGLLSEEFARAGAQVFGIDLSLSSIAIAKAHAEASGLKIDYRVSAAEAIGYRDEYFDIVVCADILEHVDDLPKTISECSRVLRRDGRLFFLTENKNLLSKIIMIHLLERLGMIPKGAHDYKKFIRPEDLRRFAREKFY